MKRATAYLLFAASGLGGLVDQVIWVRQFGKLFGNTVYSSAIVTSVFMLGLGAGSYFVGRRSDVRHRDPKTALRAYGWAEVAIAVIVVALALLLPAFSGVSARMASYSRSASDGFFQLSLGTRALQYGVAIVALGPVTFLMGGTLTLLIRYVVGSEVSQAGFRVGALYGFNTAGAALGALITDFALVPHAGIFATQLIAASASAFAGVGALILSRAAPAIKSADERADAPAEPEAPDATDASADAKNADAKNADATNADATNADASTDTSPDAKKNERVTTVALASALYLSGIAALGFEIFWFRFLSGILGAYRSVFSILLAVILLAIWLGAHVAGVLERRFKRPGLLLIASQALVTLTAGILLCTFDKDAIISQHIAKFRDAYATATDTERAIISLWHIARPTLFLTALPAFFMGATFPLANAIFQRNAKTVGARAGTLYFANTAGNVTGSLVVGFVLLPGVGIQSTAVALVLIASASLALVLVVARKSIARDRFTRIGAGAAILAAIVTIAATATIPDNGLLQPSLISSNEGFTVRVVAVKEGVNEIVTVAEVPGYERMLLTNGFPMSRTNIRAQRYMRAFSHLPLLQMENPESVLVICFGVGNTTHAASLHPSVKTLEVADLSRDILHASNLFKENHDVLHDPRVSVFVNDGRHHLAMQPEGKYDLITLEPPPIGFAGVASLYSRDFYELARSRLKRGGFLTQWLPGHQVGGEMVLSLVRAFLDVFPQAVVLSGERRELILMGTTGDTITTDVETILARLRDRPAVLADLAHVQMGALTEIFGTFVASNETMRKVTNGVAPLTDDKPLLEYNQLSGVRATRQPKELFDLGGIGAWCRDCIVDGEPNKSVKRLPDYLRILGLLYATDSFLESGAFQRKNTGFDIPEDPAAKLAIEKSPYLSSLFADELEYDVGVEHLRSGEIDEAVGALQRAVFLKPDSAHARAALKAALTKQRELRARHDKEP